MKSRNVFILALLAVMLMVVACAPQPTAEPTEEAASIDAEDATSDGCDASFRLFDHELLATDPVCVPEEPQRIAMMETVGIEVLFALDIQPVIQMDAYTQQLRSNFPTIEPQFDEYFSDIPDAGYFEVNLEVLLESEPDLIVIYDFVPAPIEQLNEIAPTVVVQLVPDVSLERMLSFHGDLLGIEEEVSALLGEYEERTIKLREAIADEIEGQSIVIARIDPQLAMFALSPAYAVLRDAGWQPPTEFDERLDMIIDEYDYGIRPVSMEELDMLDGDYLFAYDLTSASSDDGSGALQEVIDNPTWQTLSVVETGQFYTVPTYWNFSGIISSHFIIDDLFTYFSEAAPEETSPNPFLEEVEAAESSACEAGFRLFNHELSATEPLCIPEEPQRVVTLLDLDTMVMLEMIPVATWELTPFITDFPEYEWLADEDITELTWPVNPEAVLAEEPDLIISATFMGETNDDLVNIAPTVIFEFDHSGQWKDIVDFSGEALNRSDEVDILMEEYNERAENFRVAFNDEFEIPIDEFEISVVRIYPDQINLYTAGGFPGVVLSDIGFARPESQTYTAEEAQEEFENPIQYSISKEELPRVDGDAVFVVIAGVAETRTGSQEALAELRDDPLWATLNVVQEERVYEVDGYWIGSSILAAHAMLDDLYEYVLSE